MSSPNPPVFTNFVFNGGGNRPLPWPSMAGSLLDRAILRPGNCLFQSLDKEQFFYTFLSDYFKKYGIIVDFSMAVNNFRLSLMRIGPYPGKWSPFWTRIAC
jgi:hypothetical protein